MKSPNPNNTDIERKLDQTQKPYIKGWMVKNRQLRFVIIRSHFQYQKIILLLNEIMNIKENEITQQEKYQY